MSSQVIVVNSKEERFPERVAAEFIDPELEDGKILFSVDLLDDSSSILFEYLEFCVQTPAEHRQWFFMDGDRPRPLGGSFQDFLRQFEKTYTPEQSQRGDIHSVDVEEEEEYDSDDIDNGAAAATDVETHEITMEQSIKIKNIVKNLFTNRTALMELLRASDAAGLKSLKELCGVIFSYVIRCCSPEMLDHELGMFYHEENEEVSERSKALPLWQT